MKPRAHGLRVFQQKSLPRQWEAGLQRDVGHPGAPHAQDSHHEAAFAGQAHGHARAGKRPQAPELSRKQLATLRELFVSEDELLDTSRA